MGGEDRHQPRRRDAGVGAPRHLGGERAGEEGGDGTEAGGDEDAHVGERGGHDALQHLVDRPRRQLEPRVRRRADVAAERVPALVVVPRLEGVPAVAHHVLGGAVVEPRVELVDHVAVVAHGEQPDPHRRVQERRQQREPHVQHNLRDMGCSWRAPGSRNRVACLRSGGSRTPLIVAACALMFGLFIGLGIGVAIGIGTCAAAVPAAPPPPPPSATTTTAAPTTAAETTQTCMTTKKRTTSSAMLDVLTGEQEISLSSDGLEDIEDYCRALIEFAKMGESDQNTELFGTADPLSNGANSTAPRAQALLALRGAL